MSLLRKILFGSPAPSREKTWREAERDAIREQVRAEERASLSKQYLEAHKEDLSEMLTYRCVLEHIYQHSRYDPSLLEAKINLKEVKFAGNERVRQLLERIFHIEEGKEG